MKTRDLKPGDVVLVQGDVVDVYGTAPDRTAAVRVEDNGGHGFVTLTIPEANWPVPLPS